LTLELSALLSVNSQLPASWFITTLFLVIIIIINIIIFTNCNWVSARWQ